MAMVIHVRRSLGARTAVVLIGIIVIALGLRLWGIDFGLPYLYHFDEHFYVNTALHLGRGVLNNPPYNPTGLSNILVPQYAVYYIIGKLAGTFPSPLEFEAAYRSDPSVFFLLGRLTTAVLGAATTLVLYLLGKAVTDAKVGLIAAGFLSVSFLHVRDSHYAVPDVGMVFFVIFAVSLAAIGLRQRKRRAIYLAGLAGGMAIAVKWSAFPIIVPIWWAAARVEYEGHNDIIGSLINKTVVYTGVALTLGFMLLSPQILINPAPYIQNLQGIKNAAQENQSVETLSIQMKRWSFYGETVLYGLGVVLAAFSIVGLFRRLLITVKSREPMSVLVISFPLIYLPLISRGYHYARYLLPIIPFLVLFAAEAIMVLWNVVFRYNRNRLVLSLVGSMVLVAIVQPLANSVRHGVLLAREDTRTLAKQWIEATIPEGSKIAVDWPVHGPPLSTEEKRMPYSEKVYDVYTVGRIGLFTHPIAWYTDQGFDYLIVSTYISNNLGFGGNIPAVREFYDSLGEKLTLVQEFRHYQGDTERPFSFLDEIYGPTDSLWQRERPGPTIKIFRLGEG